MLERRVSVELLSSVDEGSYEDVVRDDPSGMIYQSLAYRDLLSDLLKPARPLYLVAKKAGCVVGVAPAFIRESSYGNVLNSLPFFGSHGGALVRGGRDDTSRLRRGLLETMLEMAEAEGCLVTTVISPLFLSEELLSGSDRRRTTLTETRIGQVTTLPPRGEDVEERLMQRLHSKTRNMVRKARKVGLEVSCSESERDLNLLRQLHQGAMEKKGGVAKGDRFFRLLTERFQRGRDFRVYVAHREGEPIGALLLLYFKDQVEYYTPAIDERFKALQPMSLLIFRAMRDAADWGYRIWNWGGTWHTQESLHRFKRRWGAKDHIYSYRVVCHRELSSLRGLGSAGILREYPGFYVLPFGMLEPSPAASSGAKA